MGKKLNANESFRLWMNGLGRETIKENLDKNVKRDTQGRILINKNDEWNYENWSVGEIMEQLLKEKRDLTDRYNQLGKEIKEKEQEVEDLVGLQSRVSRALIRTNIKINDIRKRTTVYENSIYKHFKGGMVATMKVSKPIDVGMINFKDNYIDVIHSETKADLKIIIDSDNNYIHDKNICHEELVLYKTLYNDTGVFARPKSMFLSKVDNIKYPDCEQEYRLELIK